MFCNMPNIYVEHRGRKVVAKNFLVRFRRMANGLLVGCSSTELSFSCVGLLKPIQSKYLRNRQDQLIFRFPYLVCQ